jgi:hypothetical protein
VVLADSPVKTYDWLVPLIKGVGSPEAWLAELQLESFIKEVEYLMS